MCVECFHIMFHNCSPGHVASESTQGPSQRGAQLSWCRNITLQTRANNRWSIAEIRLKIKILDLSDVIESEGWVSVYS